MPRSNVYCLTSNIILANEVTMTFRTNLSFVPVSKSALNMIMVHIIIVIGPGSLPMHLAR